MITRPLRVLVDATQFWPGGQSGGILPALEQMINWLRRVSNSNIHFVFVTSIAGEPEVRHWMSEGDSCVRESEVSADIASSERCDLVYCPFGMTDWSCPGVPTITLIVDLLHRDFPETLEPVDIAFREHHLRLAIARSDKFQVISDFTAGRLQALAGARPECMVKTYLPIHGRLRLQPKDVVPYDKEKFFFYPANAWKHKNHRTLLEAYALYHQSTLVDPWRLVLTGHDDNRMRAVRNYASVLGLSSYVDLLGYVDDSKLGSLWATAGALVFPSLHEGFGIPLIEAMAAGVPILANRATAIPEIVGEAALLVDCKDSYALARGMHLLSTDPGLQSRLSASGRRRLNVFQPEDQFRKLYTAFLSTAATNARYRRSGYYAIDGLVEELSMFALPDSCSKIRFAFKPLGVPRTAMFWASGHFLASVPISATDATRGTLDLPCRTRTFVAKIPDAAGLSPTDPRKHGAILHVLEACTSEGGWLDLLNE